MLRSHGFPIFRVNMVNSPVYTPSKLFVGGLTSVGCPYFTFWSLRGQGVGVAGDEINRGEGRGGSNKYCLLAISCYFR